MRSSVIECRRQFIDRARKSLKPISRKNLKERGISMRLPILQTSKKDEIIESIAVYWWEKKLREDNLFINEPEMILIRIPVAQTDPELIATIRDYNSWANTHLTRLRNTVAVPGSLPQVPVSQQHPYSAFGNRPQAIPQNIMTQPTYGIQVPSSQVRPQSNGFGVGGNSSIQWNNQNIQQQINSSIGQISNTMAQREPPTDCHCGQVIPGDSSGVLPNGVLKCSVNSCKRRFHKKCYGILQNTLCKDMASLECISCVLRSCDPLHKTCFSFTDSPFILRPRESSQLTTDSITIRVSEDKIRTLKMSLTKCIEIRCMKLDGQHLYEQTWPDEASIYFRNVLLKEIKPLEVKSSLKKRKDEKLILPLNQVVPGTHDIRIRYRNIIDNKNTMEGTNPHYAISVFIIEKLEPKELCNELISQPSHSFEKCKEFVMKQFQSGIEIPKITVSYKCVYTLGTIRTPVRGQYCQHLNTFSLEFFVATFEKNLTRKWMCPICKTRCYRIVVDVYLMKIYEFLSKSHSEVSEVDLFADASFCLSGSSVVFSPLSSGSTKPEEVQGNHTNESLEKRHEGPRSNIKHQEINLNEIAVVAEDQEGHCQSETSQMLLEKEGNREILNNSIEAKKIAASSNSREIVIDLDDEIEGSANANILPPEDPFRSSSRTGMDLEKTGVPIAKYSMRTLNEQNDSSFSASLSESNTMVPQDAMSFGGFSSAPSERQTQNGGKGFQSDANGQIVTRTLQGNPTISPVAMEIEQNSIMRARNDPRTRLADDASGQVTTTNERALPSTLRVTNFPPQVQADLLNIAMRQVQQQETPLRTIETRSHPTQNEETKGSSDSITSRNQHQNLSDEEPMQALAAFKNTMVMLSGVSRDKEEALNARLTKRLNDILSLQRHFFQTSKKFEDWSQNNKGFTKSSFKKITRTQKFHSKVFKNIENRQRKLVYSKRIFYLDDVIKGIDIEFPQLRKGVMAKPVHQHPTHQNELPTNQNPTSNVPSMSSGPSMSTAPSTNSGHSTSTVQPTSTVQSMSSGQSTAMSETHTNMHSNEAESAANSKKGRMIQESPDNWGTFDQIDASSSLSTGPIPMNSFVIQAINPEPFRQAELHSISGSSGPRLTLNFNQVQDPIPRGASSSFAGSIIQNSSNTFGKGGMGGMGMSNMQNKARRPNQDEPITLD